MADEPRRYSSVAPLKNVRALVELIHRVQNRGRGLPGMACYHGPSGYGKTTATVFAANRFQSYQVQVKSVWTKKKLCEAILEDMGITPRRTIADMLDQVAAELAKTGKPLLIDEADHLVDRGMIEIVRDIYESSGAPVILIGEEKLPTKLLQWERVHGRMLDWVGAEPAELEDVAHLAPIYAPGVEIARDLQEMLLNSSGRSIRRICVNLDRVLERSRTLGQAQLGAGDFEAGSFFTGSAPRPRSISA